MKNCDILDYKIDCENNNVTLENLFCNEVTKPNLSDICKQECPKGYISQNGLCLPCQGNKYLRFDLVSFKIIHVWNAYRDITHLKF